MTFSGFTLMSRLLGFLRDILIAGLVGTSVVADAFNAAFRFPNMFRRIFGEGAFNSAFVPLFGKRVAEDGRYSAIRFANNAFSVLFLVLGVLTIILIPLMAWIMLAVVPGFLPQFDQSLSSQQAEFRMALRGAKAVYMQVDGDPAEVKLQNLQLIERGTPPMGKVLGEVFGGEVQAVGETIPLASVVEDGLQRDSYGDVTAADLIENGVWKFGADGLLEVPLPMNHDFAILEGSASGAGDLQVYRNDPVAFDLTVLLSKITFVYLLCMALVAHLSGVLTTLKKFAAPAFSPVLLNVIFLLGLLIFARFTESREAKGLLLAWCVAIAGFVQLGLLWWTCRRAGLPVALQKPVFDPSIKRLFILMGPGVIAAGIQQINLLIGGIIASFQQGAISMLYYADRVYQLPLGMIGIAFGMVLLPEITRLLSGGKEGEASETMRKGIELAMLITVPAAIAFMTIPGEIISVLFERGAFSHEDSVKTGQALAAFAIGLPGYVLIKVLQPGYFAREDTRSPMKMAGITVIVNIVVSLLLFPFFQHVGIAVATSVAAWVNVFLLWFGLRGFVTLDSESRRRLLGMVIASVIMALCLVVAKHFLGGWLVADFWQKTIALAILISFGLTVYIAGVLGMKVTSLHELKNSFRK